MSADESFRVRFAEVQARVSAAALRSGRNSGSIRIVGATKTVPVERLRIAVESGLRDLGENRAQELVAKAPELEDLAPTWHFIGALQRNKVGMCAPFVTMWHSVDRIGLAETIAARAPGARVLLEVNLSGEAQKAGVDPTRLDELLDRSRALGLEVEGLMTVPAAGVDPRPAFAGLRARADALGLRECSMGMSGDFEVAIEEGATIVRIGRTLFGDRPAP
jgi:pyridoxal phosphate enzyme (YggS family)